MRKVITISLSPNLLDEAEELAREEKRSRSEFFREAIRNTSKIRNGSDSTAMGASKPWSKD